MGAELPPAVAGLLGRLPLGLASGDSESKLPLVLGTLAVILATSSILKFYNGLKASFDSLCSAVCLIIFEQLVAHLPGFRIPFSPYSMLGNMAPVTWWNPGLKFLWEGRKDHYRDPLIISSNLDVLRQTAFGSVRSDWEKPEEMSRSVLFWGKNLLGTDGEIWKRHRRIVNPAFNTKLYQRVWDKTLELYEQMSGAEGWTGKDTVDIEVIQKLTHQFTLLIISTCGFGLKFDWKEPPAPPGGAMTVQQAFHIVVERNLALTFLPRWLHKSIPTKYFKETEKAVDEISKFMKAQVEGRKTAVRAGNTDPEVDAFTLMVKANEEEGVKYKLDDSELIGNVFVLLFAGHETTAITLAACLVYLAMNPEVQKEVLENIIDVLGWERKPTFDDYGKLDKVLAVFLEVLRMYPSGHLLFRKATKDTTLNLPRPVGEEGADAIPISKGTMMVIDMVGLQYNPRYFEDPETFKPSRWYGVSKESDAFTAFSIGPRECIGRKFAMVEAVAFLALLLRDFKVKPLLLKGETLDAWKQRVLEVNIMITIGVKDASVRLERRQKGPSL